jgi:hypothetical protein
LHFIPEGLRCLPEDSTQAGSPDDFRANVGNTASVERTPPSEVVPLLCNTLGAQFRAIQAAPDEPPALSRFLLGDPPLAIDHVGYNRIPVVITLANLISGIALMYEGDDRGDSHDWYQQEADKDEHEDVGDEPPYAEDHDPSHLVPERLQGVEGYHPGPIFVDHPDDEGHDWASDGAY